MLAEVPEDGDLWPTEKAFIRELAAEGLLNVQGNPLRSRKRRGGKKHPAAAA